MKLTGYMNSVSKAGNIGTTVCVVGDFSRWETENKEVAGEKAVSEYVSGRHLNPGDIGKDIDLIYRKDKEGRIYCKSIIFKDAK